MLWEIREQDGQFCIFRQGASDPLKRFDERADAEAYLQALYANGPMAGKAKVKALGDGRVGGYGIAFTGPEGKDLQGEYFTAETKLWLDFYKRIPLLYQHGMDGQLVKRLVGAAEVGRVDDAGVWYEAQLNLRDEYEQMMYALAERGALGYSTGSVGHLVEVARDGKILSWPPVEISLTPTPAAGQYLTSVEAVRRAYKSVGLIAPENLRGGDEMLTEAEIRAIVAKYMAKYQVTLTEEQIKSIVAKYQVAPLTEVQIESIVAKYQVAPLTEEQIKAIVAESQVAPPSDEQIRAIVAGQVAASIEPYLKGISLADPLRQQQETDPAKMAVKAFSAFLHLGKGKGMDAAVKAALQEGTDSEGGYIVPDQYLAELVKALTEQSVVRRAGARVVGMTTDRMRVPSLTHSSAAVLTAEEAGYDEVEPTFGEIVFVPYKFTKLSKVSEELVNDSMFDIWGGVLSPDFIQAFGAAENSYFTTGTGSSQPQGVVTGAGTGVTAAGVAAITADEVIDLYHSLSHLYRPNATWMMNDAVIGYIRKLKGSDGQYLWQPGMQAGQPDRLLGRPVITNNSMAATIAASAKTVLFGDFSYFWIGQRAGMTVDINPYLYMANGQVGYFGRMRVDSHVVLAAAFKLLVQAAA